jgi:sugar lactone lactonase YvrE
MAGDAASGYATGANGLAWSPDSRVLYWADTAAHVVRAWDWDAAANVLSGERVFHQFAAKSASDGQAGHAPYQGRPDGAAVDVQGNYYVAMYEGGCVNKLSPEGTLLASFRVPAMCPTMPCFGGDDLQTLYLTTARKGRPAEELADLPLSGCVLSMRVDVPGLPVNFFAD